MKCMSVFRLKDIWTVITMTTNKVRRGRVHLAKAAETTKKKLFAKEKEGHKEEMKERINSAAVRKEVFSRLGTGGEKVVRDLERKPLAFLETLKRGE